MAMRRVDVVQYGWNMFDRRMQHEILPYCAEQGIGFMAYGSLALRPAHRHVHRGPRLRRAPTGGRARARWARSRCSARSSARRSSRTTSRAVEELKGDRGALRPEPAAARAALGDVAPGGEHRARRLPHRRRGRGQRRRDRLDDQRRRPRRDRRDLRPPRGRTRAPTSGSRRPDHGPGAVGQGRDRHRRRERDRPRDRRAVRRGGRAGRHRRRRRRARRGARRRSLGDAAAFQRTDVSDADQVQALVDFAVEHFGGLHVMCNNAGIGGSFRRFLDDDFADFDRVMARQPLRRDGRHAARGTSHGGARRRLDHQHHVDRRHQRGRGVDGVPRVEGRGHPLHADRSPSTSPTTGSG